jgi:hypothetical protein
MMFHLDSVPVSALHNVNNEGILLYVEVGAANHERNLRNKSVSEELKVPIGGRIEDSMVIEPPHVDKEILADPCDGLSETVTSVLNKSEKKKHRKNKFSEFRKKEDEVFEENFVREELGMQLLEKKHVVFIFVHYLATHFNDISLPIYNRRMFRR